MTAPGREPWTPGTRSRPRGLQETLAACCLAACCLAACCLAACGGRQSGASVPEGATQRATEIEHEPCDVESAEAERIDVNGDGRADIVIVRVAGREVCRSVDLNMDGLVDRWTYFDDQGRVRRQESDYDRDGRIDEIAYFEAGELTEKHRATTLSHRLDTWHFYDKGRLVRTERDANGDTIIDQWWEYQTPDCPLIHSDVNNDGRPDPGASVDYCKETGFVPPLRQATAAPTGRRLDAPVETVTEVESRPAPAQEPGGGEE